MIPNKVGHHVATTLSKGRSDRANPIRKLSMRSAYHHPELIGLRKKLWIAAASVCLFTGACSSRNPDALKTVNVDENYAMMDANQNTNANLASPAKSQSNSNSATTSAPPASASEETFTNRAQSRSPHGTDDPVRNHAAADLARDSDAQNGERDAAETNTQQPTDDVNPGNSEGL